MIKEKFFKIWNDLITSSIVVDTRVFNWFINFNQYISLPINTLIFFHFVFTLSLQTFLLWTSLTLSFWRRFSPLVCIHWRDFYIFGEQVFSYVFFLLVLWLFIFDTFLYHFLFCFFFFCSIYRLHLFHIILSINLH